MLDLFSINMLISVFINRKYGLYLPYLHIFAMAMANFFRTFVSHIVLTSNGDFYHKWKYQKERKATNRHTESQNILLHKETFWKLFFLCFLFIYFRLRFDFICFSYRVIGGEREHIVIRRKFMVSFCCIF